MTKLQHTITFLDKDQTIAPMIGHIIGRWAHLENQLCFLLQILLTCDQARAEIVFYSLNSYRSRAELILRLGRNFLADKHYMKLKNIMKTLKRAATIRNTVAHSPVIPSESRHNVRFIQIQFPHETEGEWTPAFPSLSKQKLAGTSRSISIQHAAIENLLLEIVRSGIYKLPPRLRQHTLAETTNSPLPPPNDQTTP